MPLDSIKEKMLGDKPLVTSTIPTMEKVFRLELWEHILVSHYFPISQIRQR